MKFLSLCIFIAFSLQVEADSGLKVGTLIDTIVRDFPFEWAQSQLMDLSTDVSPITMRLEIEHKPEYQSEVISQYSKEQIGSSARIAEKTYACELDVDSLKISKGPDGDFLLYQVYPLVKLTTQTRSRGLVIKEGQYIRSDTWGEQDYHECLKLLAHRLDLKANNYLKTIGTRSK